MGPPKRDIIQMRKSTSGLSNQERRVAFKTELNRVAGFQQSRRRKVHEEKTKSLEGRDVTRERQVVWIRI